MDYLLVGIGGICGSLTRFILGRFISERAKSVFPWGTFAINISGALLLGIVSDFQDLHKVYMLLGNGFLGAYTTFSTFMYEGFNLFKDRESINALIYVVLSLCLGIFGFFIGTGIGRLF
jgi:CrcB protein